MRWWLRTGGGLLGSLLLGGCALGYYWQAASGQLKLLRQRVPVQELLANPDTGPVLRGRLERAREILEFAHDELRLPDNGSYRFYADIGRPYVVWNVFAAPELSVELRRWCYPVAGCVTYRGYFAESAARDFAAKLAGQGDDVFVGGVPAYSTLGRFKDPLLDSMLTLPDDRLAGLLFHELAHQRVYLRGDTAFNESFAAAVEVAGVERWLSERGDDRQRRRYRTLRERRAQVLALLDSARAQLRALYSSGLSPTEKRRRKSALFEALRADHARLRAGWPDPPYFDEWFGPQLNNASLGALAAYEEFVPAFLGLLRVNGDDFERFFEQVEALARLDASDRQARLAALAAGP